MTKKAQLKLHRTHYSVSETAKLLECDVLDIMYLIEKKDFSLSLQICGRWSFSKHRVRDVTSFVNNINSLEKDADGFSFISEFSLIKLDEVKEDKKLVLASIKGFYQMPPNVKRDYVYYEGQFPEYPSLFVLAGKPFTESIKYVQVDWSRDNGLGYEGEGYLDSGSVRQIYQLLNGEQANDERYKALSIAQQERHANIRNEVLSVALYLYKENSNHRKENATALANIIFDRAAEFWPESKTPPLSHPIVTKLISSIFNKPIFTKN